MAIDKNKLASIIQGKAKALCNPMRDNDKPNKINGGYQNYNTTYDFEDPYLTESYSSKSTQDISFTTENLQNSKLPQFIKESMATQHIDMTNTGGLSVLDSMGIKPEKKPINRQVVNENVTNPSIMQVSNGIDYTIIKAIVNECLKEYFDNKQTLNESASLQTIGLQNGNISLVDNKGNIYKAKLEKIGNKNDKR